MVNTRTSTKKSKAAPAARRPAPKAVPARDVPPVAIPPQRKTTRTKKGNAKTTPETVEPSGDGHEHQTRNSPSNEDASGPRQNAQDNLVGFFVSRLSDSAHVIKQIRVDEPDEVADGPAEQPMPSTVAADGDKDMDANGKPHPHVESSQLIRPSCSPR